MDIFCTRPGCSRPQNFFSDLDNPKTLKTTQQKYCTKCGMPLILASRYLPSKLLGKGGFGAAFLAKDLHTPTMRSCVVKQFQPEGNLTDHTLSIAQTLFEREAATLEILGNKHPQIPQLYASFPLIVPNKLAGKDEQFFYLVQEFIDGQDLEKELATKKIFSELEVLEILREILKILQFIHENGSIHRDIKPANIMRNKAGILYLIDFGAVKQVTTVGSNTIICSQGFSPPEQMQGSQVYPCTDLYALAATCVNLLSGKSPKDLYDSYNNRWNWKSSAPQVSDRLAAILDRLLLPTPSDRFASATEVLEALPLTPPQVSSTTLQSSTTLPPPSPLSPPLSRRSFSSVELLRCAGFTGFEGALLIMAFQSLIAAPGIVLGCMGIGGLIYAQSRRILEGKDLLIIGGITFLLLMLIPVFQGNLDRALMAIIAILSGAGAIAVTALFRLIYQILSRWF